MADLIYTYFLAYMVVWMASSSWRQTIEGTLGAWLVLYVLDRLSGV